jgi:hypothetical protein
MGSEAAYRSAVLSEGMVYGLVSRVSQRVGDYLPPPRCRDVLCGVHEAIL